MPWPQFTIFRIFAIGYYNASLNIETHFLVYR